MRRALAAFALSFAVCGRVVYAQDVAPDTADAAAAAQVDAVDLQGAVNTTHLDPWEYLYRVGELKRPAPKGWTARVRLTHYDFGGVTAGCRFHSYNECQGDVMGHPFYGSTACSWNFALGTRFVVAGETFLCNDRGLLGSTGWLDLWRRADLMTRDGYADVVVLP